MAYDVYNKHDSRIGIYAQTTWGTALAAGVAFQELPNDPGAVFSQNVNLRRPNRSYASTLGGQRMPDIRDVSNDVKGVAPTIPIAGDVRKDDLAELLYLVMQGVTEDGTTPFKKQFEFPATQPDFTANAGMFCGVCGRHPTGNTSVLMSDSIIRTLTLSASPTANEGRLHSAEEYIGRAPLTHQFNPSGTWTRVDEEFFYFHDLGGVLLDTSDIDISSFELAIANNATPVGVEVGGTSQFATFALPRYTATAKISVLYSETTYSWMRGHYQTGTQTTFRIYWGNASPSADGDLRIDMSAVVTAAPRVLADTHEIALEFEMVTDVVTSGEDSDDHGLVIQLCDGKDRTW